MVMISRWVTVAKNNNLVFPTAGDYNQLVNFFEKDEVCQVNSMILGICLGVT